ncbi:MAG: HPr family phosphocarrier protein [Pyrinomonadaceae bacterium]
MLEAAVRVTNTLGLHARAAAKLVRLASTFDAMVTLKRDDTNVEANARSILDLLYLAAGQGVQVKITFNGVDEVEAAAAITKLFKNGFGEDQQPEME